MKKIQSIKFPILFRFDDMTVPCGLEFIKFWKFKHHQENTFTLREGIHPEARLHWIIDSDGLFRKATIVKIRNEWARPLRYIVSLVQQFYEVSPGEQITVQNLLQEIEGTREDPDKSSTRDLRRYLTKKQPEDYFTREMFLEFMNETETTEFPEYP